MRLQNALICRFARCSHPSNAALLLNNLKSAQGYRLASAERLKRCRFLIADFTENSHNVYFEAGYAKGMDKPVIWTKRVGEEEHFDTRQFYFIEWSDADWADFELRLETSIGAIVGRLVAKLAAS